MAVVLDLTTREELIRLRSAGFESCAVAAPDWLDERSLCRFYRHPTRADAHAFVDELIGLCSTPSLRAEQLAALSPVDRARLRRAIVSVCGHESQWRALWGSHLTPDERLFAVMFWRWRDQERLFGRLRARRAELDEQRERSMPGLMDLAETQIAGATVRSPSLELALRGVKPTFDLARFRPPLFEATRHLSAISSIGAGIQMPSVIQLDEVKKATQAAQAHSRAFAFMRGTQPLFNTSNSIAALVSGVKVDTRLMSSGVKVDARMMSYGALVPAWMTAVRVAGDWQHALSVAADFRRLGASFSAVTLPSSLLDISKSLLQPSESLREFVEAMEVVGRFERRWQQRALSFIVSGLFATCGVWELHDLAALSEAEVEAAILYALESVISDGTFVSALRAVISRAPHINESQRTHLDHGLEHAAEQDYVRACPSLYSGIEGAFWRAGYGLAVVTVDQKDPRNTNKGVGFDRLVKLLGLDPEFSTFMNRALFGTVGNPYRHGDAEGGERRQVLLGIAALAGWCEEFANEQAWTALIQRAARALPQAILNARLPALPPSV